MIAFIVAVLVAAADPYATGQRVADITLLDDAGRQRSMNEFRGQPVIIAPLYTRCPLACPLIASSLTRASAAAKALPSTYRVIVFSFDARDRPDDLRRFRERHHLPIGWTVATAKEADIRRFTDSIGFHFAAAGDGFTHPNLIVALRPDLVTARYLHGTSYSAADLDEALAVARGGIDWTGRFGPFALAVVLLICTLSGGYVLTLLMRRGRATAAAAAPAGAPSPSRDASPDRRR